MSVKAGLGRRPRLVTIYDRADSGYNCAVLVTACQWHFPAAEE